MRKKEMENLIYTVIKKVHREEQLTKKDLEPVLQLFKGAGLTIGGIEAGLLSAIATGNPYLLPAGMIPALLYTGKISLPEIKQVIKTASKRFRDIASKKLGKVI